MASGTELIEGEFRGLMFHIMKVVFRALSYTCFFLDLKVSEVGWVHTSLDSSEEMLQ